MSGISLADAQSTLDALIEAQKCDPIGALGSVSINGRTVTYKDSKDLIEQINYWSRIVAGLQRTAAGASRHGFVLPNFNGRCR